MFHARNLYNSLPWKYIPACGSGKSVFVGNDIGCDAGCLYSAAGKADEKIFYIADPWLGNADWGKHSDDFDAPMDYEPGAGRTEHACHELYCIVWNHLRFFLLSYRSEDGGSGKCQHAGMYRTGGGGNYLGCMAEGSVPDDGSAGLCIGDIGSVYYFAESDEGGDRTWMNRQGSKLRWLH